MAILELASVENVTGTRSIYYATCHRKGQVRTDPGVRSAGRLAWLGIG